MWYNLTAFPVESGRTVVNAPYPYHFLCGTGEAENTGVPELLIHASQENWPPNQVPSSDSRGVS